MEKLIHKAKRLSPSDHLYLQQNVRTQKAMHNLKNKIAPRFKDLPAGFTRVEYCGTRANDRAKVGMIEILGNKHQEEMKNRLNEEKEDADLETFWQWEAKICEQEVDYYEQLLRDLKATIDAEIAEKLEQAGLEDYDPSTNKKLTK